MNRRGFFSRMAGLLGFPLISPLFISGKVRFYRMRRENTK